MIPVLKYLHLPVILALAGCTLGPDYSRPVPNLPVQYRDATLRQTEAESIADMDWWEFYTDPILRELIADALLNNLDLRVAAARVEQARAQAAQARGAFFPQAGYLGEASRGRNQALGAPSYNAGETNSPAFAGVQASWEIDIWGRIRRLNEAARADLFATEEGRRTVTLALVGEVAQAYYELLNFYLRRDIAEAATASFARSLELFEIRLQRGAASLLETSSAEGARAAAAAAIPEFERQISLTENRLSLLLGRYPGPIAVNPDAIEYKAAAGEIPVGLPSTLLERRPDIRQAEALLAAANARIGVAEANFFPQISLTGMLGRVSPELSAFTAGTGNAWSVAAQLAGPIFQGGILRAQRQQAIAAWEESVFNYEQTVLNALREIANALVSLEQLELVRQQQAEAVRAYRKAVEVAFDRYQSGKADYFEVIQWQQQLFPIEDALAQTELNQSLSRVQLYRALGGGWTATVELDDD